MTNRDRSDSDFVQTQIIQDAANGIAVPDCVTLEEWEMPFWKAITEARAQWTNIDLIHAANFARCLYSIEENTKLLKEEGDVVENARGTQIMNPRFSVLEQLTRRSTSLSSKIQVHAAATIGEAKNNRAKNAAKAKAVTTHGSQQDRIEDSDDDLLAKPTAH